MNECGRERKNVVSTLSGFKADFCHIYFMHSKMISFVTCVYTSGAPLENKTRGLT
jgi:hypothetical protein